MNNELKLRRNFKIASRFVFKFFLSTVLIALMSWIFTYPFGWANCKAYGYAKEIPTKYVYFECYVHSDKKGWLTKEEFQSSEIGAKLTLSVN